MLTAPKIRANIPYMRKTITTDDVLNRLRERIAVSSLRKTALELGVSAPYLSDVMRGNRDVSTKLSKALGLRRSVVINKTVTFEKVA